MWCLIAQITFDVFSHMFISGYIEIYSVFYYPYLLKVCIVHRFQLLLKNKISSLQATRTLKTKTFLYATHTHR